MMGSQLCQHRSPFSYLDFSSRSYMHPSSFSTCLYIHPLKQEIQNYCRSYVIFVSDNGAMHMALEDSLILQWVGLILELHQSWQLVHLTRKNVSDRLTIQL